MTNRQRLTYLAIAAVIAVAAVVVLAIGGGDDGDEADVAATPTPTATAAQQQSADDAATPTPTATATARPQPPLLRAGRSRTLTFKSGDTIRFRVRNPTAEEIHVHGYDITRPVPAGRTVTVSFEADLEGIFEVELHGTGEQIASLKVEP